MQPAQTKKFSLRENVRLRLLKDMLSGLKQSFSNVPNFIMVVDSMTTRIISSCAKMIELLEEGVVAIERLDLVRKPFPNMHAIYFISPTDDSVDRVIKDFDNGKSPQYGNIHLFFTNKCDNALVEKLTKKKTLIDRVLTFKEINLDFLCPEENIFHFDMPEALPVVFSKQGSPQEKDLEEKIAYKLASVIPTLFDYEKFQIIYNKNTGNGVSERVARILEERIQRFLELRKTDDDDEPPAPVKVVILDRSFDPLTPLLHDYYYMSLVYDLLEVKNDIVEYTTEDNQGKAMTKKAVLNESDDLWMKYKYKHIAESMNKISEEFSQFVQNNKTAAIQRGDTGDLDLKTMGEIVKKMPMYKELMGKYTLHMTLIEECLKAFNKKELKELGEIEQCLATGIDNTGQSVKNPKLISMIAQRMAYGKLESGDKLRLMMIASVALDLNEKDRKSLIQSLPDNDKATLNKLFWLGIDPAKVSSSKGKTSDKSSQISTSAKNKLKNISFDLCRYTPPLENIANSVAANKIDKDQFGTINIPKNYDGSIGQRSKITAGSTSIRKGANKATNWNDNMDERNQPKFIFFIIGGMSHAEIRILNEFESSNAYLTVIRGATSIIRPQDFIDGIGEMISQSEYDELKQKI
jgi:syntaxin-binding protein 1